MIEGNPDRFVRRNPIHRIRIDFFCVRRHQKGALIGVIAARFIPAENQNGILSLLSAVGSINDAVQPVKVKLPRFGIAGCLAAQDAFQRLFFRMPQTPIHDRLALFAGITGDETGIEFHRRQVNGKAAGIVQFAAFFIQADLTRHAFAGIEILGAGKDDVDIIFITILIRNLLASQYRHVILADCLQKGRRCVQTARHRRIGRGTELCTESKSFLILPVLVLISTIRNRHPLILKEGTVIARQFPGGSCIFLEILFRPGNLKIAVQHLDISRENVLSAVGAKLFYLAAAREIDRHAAQIIVSQRAPEP